MAKLVAVAVAITAACSPAQRLTANSPLEASRGDGVSARMIQLDLHENANHQVGELGTATVEITNRSHAPVDVHKDRMQFVGLAVDPGPVQGEGGIGLGITGNGLGGSSGSLGSSGSSGAGGVSPGAVGSGIGVGLGIIAVGIILVPVGLGYLIYKGVTEPPDRLEPGERARYRIDVTRPTTDVAQHLTLGVALDDGGQVLNVPVIDPTRPHGGWGAPRRLDQIGMRLGGGPIVGDGKFSGTGGVQLLARRRIGPTYVGGSISLVGVSASLGPELAIPIALGTDLVELAPTVSAEAGAALIGRTYFLSPSGGAELTFPAERWNLLGWNTTGIRAGLYGKAGPIWIDSGREWRWEVGFTLR